MILSLRHAYPYPFPSPADLPDAELETINSAASGIVLDIPGVVHFEWLHTVTVEFATDADYEAAIQQTGWARWSPRRVLEAPTSAGDGYDHPAIIVGDKAYCGFVLHVEGHSHAR